MIGLFANGRVSRTQGYVRMTDDQGVTAEFIGESNADAMAASGHMCDLPQRDSGERVNVETAIGRHGGSGPYAYPAPPGRGLGVTHLRCGDDQKKEKGRHNGSGHALQHHADKSPREGD
jgi:hypothetical protein